MSCCLLVRPSTGRSQELITLYKPAQNTGNDVENATSCFQHRPKQIADKSLIAVNTNEGKKEIFYVDF